MPALDELRYDANGLIPAIIQEDETNEVLMMAYMNRASLARTIESGKTHFWSRSRQKYWMKGETSGHVQEVVTVATDCDADTVLIRVRQHGAACHEGYHNCFYRQLAGDAWQVVADRQVDPEDVYGKKG